MRADLLGEVRYGKPSADNPLVARPKTRRTLRSGIPWQPPYSLSDSRTTRCDRVILIVAGYESMVH